MAQQSRKEGVGSSLSVSSVAGNGEKAAAACSVAGFKFSVDAPEFVPRSTTCQQQISGYLYPCVQFLGGDSDSISAAAVASSDWFYLADQFPLSFLAAPQSCIAVNSRSNNNDIAQKIVKQVEYQFSDMNLIASDFLMKIMCKDPEGYVPMSVISSWKKIKALGATNQMLIHALRSSSKLIVSDDGKRIRRKKLFTEQDKEELQSRTVVVENIPDGYSGPSIEKMFNVVGKVKNVRICHPQEPNASRSSKSSEALISNKLHALVEFETAEQADKAVSILNDERNWRKGLRVRTIIRHSPRSVIRNKRFEMDHLDANSEDDRSPLQQSWERNQMDHILEQAMLEDHQSGSSSSSAVKRAYGRGRGMLSPSPLQQHVIIATKSTSPRGPKTPDGTRGFAAGRGKIHVTNSGASV